MKASTEVICTTRGKIISAIDHGTVWQVLYESEGEGLGVLYFDHRPFAHFYEGATGRSFFEDYRFGAGLEYVSRQLEGVRISVEGDAFEHVVRWEED